MSEPPSKSLLRRRLSLGIRLIVAVIALVILWFIAVRLTSPLRALRVVEDVDVPLMTETAPSRTLRIGTWNIAHCRGLSRTNWNGESTDQKKQRAIDIARVLADKNLDIVILNEVDFDATWSGGENQAAIIAREAGYRYRLEQRNVDTAIPFFALRFGNALLSRYPIHTAERLSFPSLRWWQTLLAGNKDGAICSVDLPEDRVVRVAPVHLDHTWSGFEQRNTSARAILAARASTDPETHLPLIVAGDFNTGLPGFQQVRSHDEPFSAVSILLDGASLQTVPMSDPQPYDNTYQTNNLVRVIDWILVPSEWTLVSREVLHSTLSDHLPVFMEVEITSDKD